MRSNYHLLVSIQLYTISFKSFSNLNAWEWIENKWCALVDPQIGSLDRKGRDPSPIIMHIADNSGVGAYGIVDYSQILAEIGASLSTC